MTRQSVSVQIRITNLADEYMKASASAYMRVSAVNCHFSVFNFMFSSNSFLKGNIVGRINGSGKLKKKMPAVVLLKKSLEIKIIRSDWVNKSQAELRNGGIRPNVPVKIFYSPNKMQPADFRLVPQSVFDRHATACYVAFVLKITGE